MRLTLTELKKKIAKVIPKNIDYEVDLEAGSISIITKTPKSFVDGAENLTVKIAKLVKRKIVVRPHPSILVDEKQVQDRIEKSVAFCRKYGISN